MDKDNAVYPNGKLVPPDLSDIAELFSKTDDDPLTTASPTSVPVGKPRDFFRLVPLREYRERTEFYRHKSENTIEEEHYLIGPKMQGRIIEARPCLLVTCVDRFGNPRLWPLTLPRDGEKDNDNWVRARELAREAQTQWLRIVWNGKGYTKRVAEKGYAPEPDFTKLPSFYELVRLAFGDDGVIRDETHPVYRHLFGIASEAAEDDGELL
jgi:hypothetical protein